MEGNAGIRTSMALEGRGEKLGEWIVLFHEQMFVYLL